MFNGCICVLSPTLKKITQIIQEFVLLTPDHTPDMGPVKSSLEILQRQSEAVDSKLASIEGNIKLLELQNQCKYLCAAESFTWHVLLLMCNIFIGLSVLYFTSLYFADARNTEIYAPSRYIVMLDIMETVTSSGKTKPLAIHLCNDLILFSKPSSNGKSFKLITAIELAFAELTVDKSSQLITVTVTGRPHPSLGERLGDGVVSVAKSFVCKDEIFLESWFNCIDKCIKNQRRNTRNLKALVGSNNHTMSDSSGVKPMSLVQKRMLNQRAAIVDEFLDVESAAVESLQGLYLYCLEPLLAGCKSGQLKLRAGSSSNGLAKEVAIPSTTLAKLQEASVQVMLKASETMLNSYNELISALKNAGIAASWG